MEDIIIASVVGHYVVKKKSLGNNVGISHAVESKYIITGQRDKSVILMLGIQVPTVRQVFQKNL